jgi:hypothetical protein
VITKRELAERRMKLRREKVDKFLRKVARVEYALEDLGVTPDLAPGADSLQDATDTLIAALSFLQAEQRRKSVGGVNASGKVISGRNHVDMITRQ